MTLIDELKRDYRNRKDVERLELLRTRDYRLKKGRKAKGGSLQAVLAFDTTPSMGEFRKVVRDKFDYIAGALGEMLDYVEISVVGVSEYGHHPLDYQQTFNFANPEKPIRRRQRTSFSRFTRHNFSGFYDLPYDVTTNHPLPKDIERIVNRYIDNAKKTALQIRLFESDLRKVKRNIQSLRNGPGAVDGQVSLELLIHEINGWGLKDYNKCLVFVSDQIPHGMDKYFDMEVLPHERFSRFKPLVDYREELKKLKENFNFYFVSRADEHDRDFSSEEIRHMQRSMVDNEKYFLDIEQLDKLPNLIVGMCMSEVGRLGYLMSEME